MSIGIPVTKEQIADVRRSCEPVNVYGSDVHHNASICLHPEIIIALCDTVEAFRAALQRREDA